MSFSINRQDLSREQEEIIREVLFIKPQDNGIFKKEADPPIIFYRLDDLGFLHLPYYFSRLLLRVFPNGGVDHTRTKINFHGSLRDNQIAPFNDCLNQLMEHGTTTVNLPTGFGKTVIAAALASKLGLITIALSHRVNLLRSWRKVFEDHTDCKIWVVGEEVPNEANVIICTDTRWEKIDVEFRKKIGVMIIDEAPHFCTATRVNCLLAFQPKFIICETAYMARKDGMHEIMYALVGMHSVGTAYRKPFTVYKINTGFVPDRVMKKIKDKFGRLIDIPDYNKMTKSILYNEHRNNYIMKAVMANTANKFMILTHETKHVHLLHSMINQVEPSCDWFCGTRQIYSDSRVLTSTLPKVGVGFDEANFCPDFKDKPSDVVMIVGSIKDEAQLAQAYGRAMRADKPIIMHLVDNDKIYDNHWKVAVRHCEENNGTIIEVG